MDSGQDSHSVRINSLTKLRCELVLSILSKIVYCESGGLFLKSYVTDTGKLYSVRYYISMPRELWCPTCKAGFTCLAKLRIRWSAIRCIQP